ARADVAAARRAHDIARRAEEESRTELLDLRASLKEAAEEHRFPVYRAGPVGSLRALDHLRVLLISALRALDALARQLVVHDRHTVDWRKARSVRHMAEEPRPSAFDDWITVRRQIELGDRARGVASDEQLDSARTQVHERAEEAVRRLPELERSAQLARDERVGAEARLDVATRELTEQVTRTLVAGDVLV